MASTSGNKVISSDDEAVITISNQVARKSTAKVARVEKTSTVTAEPGSTSPIPISESPVPFDIDALYTPAPDSDPELSQREPSRRASANRQLQNTASSFMANFNPDTSSRERRKLSRKIRNINHSYVKTKSKPKPPPPGALYDEFGIHLESGLDLCDCLEDDCDGCFFPCPKCKSEKCGNECRVHRDYVIEYAEIHGTLEIVKNPLCPSLEVESIYENRSSF